MKLKKVILIGIIAILCYIIFGISNSIYGASISVYYGFPIGWSEYCKDDVEQRSEIIELGIIDPNPYYLSIVAEIFKTTVNSPRIIEGKERYGTYISNVCGVRVGRKFELTRKMSILGFYGVGILSDYQPEIHESGIASHFGGTIEYNIFGDVCINYSVIHTSDPCYHGDSGLEKQYLGIRVFF